MKVKRMTAQQTVKLWALFYEEYGPQQMYDSFGWKHTPETVPKGKLMYAFGVKGTCVGWGGIYLNTHDATDTEAYLTVGVFKDHQGHGYRKEILEWLAKKALSLGADSVWILVFKRNTKQSARTLREAEGPGVVWRHAGAVWYPEESATDFFVYQPPDEQPSPQDDGDGSTETSQSDGTTQPQLP